MTNLCRCGKPAVECPGCGSRTCPECDLAPLDLDLARRHSPLIHLLVEEPASERVVVFATRGRMRDCLAKARSVREAVATRCPCFVDWSRDTNTATVSVPVECETLARELVAATLAPRRPEKKRRRDPVAWMRG